MGHPIRTNLFREGSNEREHFSRFPIQAAVLFSPSDRAFLDAFRDAFLHLDQLTGELVAFFAVLDPPQAWLEVAESREWWQRYSRHLGKVGYSQDDAVLVKEIARLFGVSWDELPVLVIANDLWLGRRLCVGTSIWEFEEQLAELTRIAREWERPRLGLIADELSERFGKEVRFLSGPANGSRRLERIYQFLESGGPHDDRNDRFQRYLIDELWAVERALRSITTAARSPYDEGPREDLMEAASVDALLEDVAGRLTAPATVAFRERRNFLDWHPQMGDAGEGLDDFSLVNLETAYRVGKMLELDAEDGFHLRATPRSVLTGGRPGPRLRAPEPIRDFRSGAHGAWVAFEREINLSLVQAARAAQTVKMPELFALFDPALPKDRACVRVRNRSGGSFTVNINAKGENFSETRWHRFLELGTALCTHATMSVDSKEFDRVLRHCLGGTTIPKEVQDDWWAVHGIRNAGSHAQRPVNQQDYERVLRAVSDSRVMSPLLRIKSVLRARHS